MKTAPQVVSLIGVVYDDLYGHTQCDESIHDGSVLITDYGIIIMVDAWPVSVNVSEDNQFNIGIHRLDKYTDWYHFDAGRYEKSYELAMSIINKG